MRALKRHIGETVMIRTASGEFQGVVEWATRDAVSLMQVSVPSHGGGQLGDAVRLLVPAAAIDWVQVGNG